MLDRIIRLSATHRGIVFLLVDSELLSRQDSDSIDDFRDAFEIDQVFEAYRPKLPPELGPHPASDD